jgi:hypothetical protein
MLKACNYTFRACNYTLKACNYMLKAYFLMLFSAKISNLRKSVNKKIPKFDFCAKIPEFFLFGRQPFPAKSSSGYSSALFLCLCLAKRFFNSS